MSIEIETFIFLPSKNLNPKMSSYTFIKPDNIWLLNNKETKIIFYAETGGVRMYQILLSQTGKQGGSYNFTITGDSMYFNIN